MFHNKGILISQKNYSEKRFFGSNSIEASINFQKIIRDYKLEDLKIFLLENKSIDPKIVEDGLISILKTKEKSINKGFIEMLLSLNLDLNRTDNDGKNCLIYASERGDAEIVKLMLNYKADPQFVNKDNKNALFYAIDNKDNRELYEIISVLAPCSDVNIVSKECETPLMKAIEKQYNQIVEILLENKADPNLKNPKTWDTPLHVCLKNKNKKVFMLLIENRCDVKLKNKKNFTGLDLIENDKDFKNHFESWTKLNSKNDLIANHCSLNENSINGAKDRHHNEKKKKKKNSKPANKNLNNLTENIKLAIDNFSEKSKINNILEKFPKSTEKSISSRQSSNSKSKSEINQVENKKHNSKDQSVDSKRSDTLDNQILLQNYVSEIDKNKTEIKVLKNTIKSNCDKIKDLELKLDMIAKENLELKKINEKLKEQVMTESQIHKCSTDVKKLLVEKNFKNEKKFSILNEETIDLTLNSEIIDFCDKISEINNSNKALFDKLIKNFRNIISEIFPNAKIHLYGSYATDLCLPYSDIDLVVELPNENKQPQKSYIEKNLQKLEESLKKEDFIQEIKNIFSASIPLIKITCNGEFLNKKVDITIQDLNHNGIKCVSLIKDYVKDYPLLKYLVLVLKHLLYICDSSDSYSGGLSSYGLILMVKSFLQMKNLRNVKYEENIGILEKTLLDFLFLFGKNFNYYNTIITPGQNSMYPFFISHCAWKTTQEGIYIPLEKLRIIDPITERNDVGRCTFLVSSIKSIFFNAYLGIRLNYCMENGFVGEPKKLLNEVEIKQTCCNLKKMFYLPKIFGY